MLNDLRYRLRVLFRRNAAESELGDELQFHFDQQVDKLVRSGLSRAEAIRQTRLLFGGMDQVKEECRDARGVSALSTLGQDLRHALRIWRQNPGFVLAAVTAIALGIGANATVFTIANAVLFKTLAFEDGRRLVYLQGTEPGCDFPCDTGRSYADFLDFRSQTKTMMALVAYAFEHVNVSDHHGLPERFFAMRMSANGFSALGLTPEFGRDFMAADERPDATPVVMLTHAVWESRYGGEPSIIGQTIRVNETPTVVIGVMPRKMQFRVSVDMWLPLVPTGAWRKRDYRGAMMLGRLADGATLESARTEMAMISRRLEAAYPGADRDIGIRVLEGKEYFSPRIRMVLKALWIAVGLVLLIACGNVANLLLARAVVRRREIAIRVALGAGRGRVIRQLLVESVALSTAGGVMGWLLAMVGVRAFDAAVAGTGKPAWLDFSMDSTVIAYLCAITVGAGIVFGLAPALRLSKTDVHLALKDGGRGASGGSRGRRLAGLLVAGEMALTVMLLTGTVLMIRTQVSIYRADIGVNPANVLTMRMDLPQKQYARVEDRIAFFTRLRERLGTLPGVEAATVASTLPGRGGMSFGYEIEGARRVNARMPRSTA